MTTSQDLLGAAYDAMAPVAVAAGAILLTPATLPNQLGTRYWKLRLVGEQKQSQGKGGIYFTVTATIRATLELSQPVQSNGEGATAAEVELWQHVRLVECALINSYPLFSLIQEMPSVRSQLAFNSDGATHLAGAQMDIELEFVQDANDFAPLDLADLLSIDASDPDHPGAGVTVTLPQ